MPVGYDVRSLLQVYDYAGAGLLHDAIATMPDDGLLRNTGLYVDDGGTDQFGDCLDDGFLGLEDLGLGNQIRVAEE